MSYAMEYDNRAIAAEASESARAGFIRRTYTHLAGAILAFILVEAIALQLVDGPRMLGIMFANQWSWFVVLALFIGGSMIAQRWAQSDMPVGTQYFGLGLYVLLEAAIFLPILWVANNFFPGESIILKAAILTLAIFGGLTVGVFMTGHDFSFLRTALWAGAFGMLGVALCGAIFGFGLGIWFAFLGVALACGFILYDTSNILHHYHTDQHVAAALALFASVALLFWYILQIVMSSSRE